MITSKDFSHLKTCARGSFTKEKQLNLFSKLTKFNFYLLDIPAIVSRMVAATEKITDYRLLRLYQSLDPEIPDPLSGIFPINIAASFDGFPALLFAGLPCPFQRIAEPWKSDYSNLIYSATISCWIVPFLLFQRFVTDGFPNCNYFFAT